MFSEKLIELAVDYILFASCIFIVLGSIFLSFKMRFIQLHFFPFLLKMLKNSFSNEKQKEGKYTIKPYKALLTAMSTTLGIGTIVGPVIAIHLGGPGALLGFLLMAFFGSAATFTEVGLAVKFRKKMETGEIHGGPMYYLKQILSASAAKWYALCGCILMTAWSGAQANQLAAILDSPLLGDYRISTVLSGLIISLLVFVTLLGGIKRISALSSKLVPLMFLFYVGACLWIVFSNLEKIGGVFSLIVDSAFSPYAMASGTVVGGIVSAMRWGVYKGTQITEAGVGTQAIPHSMAETEDHYTQAMMSMLSTYTAGFLGFLSGCVALITETWQDPSLPLGMSMVAASFHMYFSNFGIAIIAISTFLFGFGTILGNSYNGSQCFGYIVDRKWTIYYYAITACIVFIGTISSVKLVWTVIDIGLACIVLPHMVALLKYTHQKSEELLMPEKKKTPVVNELGVEPVIL